MTVPLVQRRRPGGRHHGLSSATRTVGDRQAWPPLRDVLPRPEGPVALVQSGDDSALAGLLCACCLFGTVVWGLAIYGLWHLLT